MLTGSRPLVPDPQQQTFGGQMATQGTQPRTYRVVQWTTGNVGQRSVLATLANPSLELVGCYAWGPDKVGRDVGELAGTAPIGVIATNDVAALLALKPDCVIYNPRWSSVDELVTILESGANVVATSEFITGHSLGPGRQRVIDACERGGSSIFGSGMNPGLANLLGIVSAQVCDRIDSISVLESVDSTGYDSGDVEMSVGYARPIDDPELPALVEKGTAVFGDAVYLTADALGLDIDEVRCEASFAQTTQDLDLGSWSIKAGCVAGVSASWQGRRDGKTIIELKVRWRKGKTLEPDWEVQHGYVVDIQGLPCVNTKLEIYPPKDFVAKSFIDYMVLGMIMTAMPALNAVEAVVGARPGIVTYLDMPLPRPSGWVR
jgi:2,4-diaminopentanoate dehydrogenase